MRLTALKNTHTFFSCSGTSGVDSLKEYKNHQKGNKNDNVANYVKR